MAKITVSASWMKACGFEAKDTAMDVISVCGVTPGGEKMFKVVRPNDNREWIVAEWRCVGH
jgi:hypothetical protein